MASTFHLPLNLKLAQLKQLAFKCGLQTTGTKPILLTRLHHEISSVESHSPKPTKLFSVDMGIRNLAYCILQIPPKKSVKVQSPTLEAWHRLAVSSAPAKSLDDEEEEPVKKEAFDPATLSAAAYKFLHPRLLQHKPTHILIERQRFRSMGSKHILEWTIRVNMFESILYATLHTLQAQGIWDGIVIPIAPGKVGPFWIEEEDTSTIKDKKQKKRKAASAKAQNKGAKIDLVRNWLESGDVVKVENEEVEKMVARYIEKWDRAPGGRKGGKKEGEEKMGKLDDLADCLLQGMAWVKWEENKRLALKSGWEALLDA